MAERYVAFLDTLGFKGQVARQTQKESEEMIRGIAATVREEWNRCQKDDAGLMTALLVSDSVIAYTEDVSDRALAMLLQFSLALCKSTFWKNGILLRGAISKGNFMEVRNEPTQNLREELMVGQAYISAYTLESKVKSSSILMGKDVRDDIISRFGTTKYIVDTTEKEGIYSLRWADVAYLQNWGVMEHFVKLANEGNWRPHYYNTLYSFLRKGHSEARRRDVFKQILKLAAMNEAGEPDPHHWHKQDEFI
ncbi:MAG: hypothetical protein IJC68_04290, partial [Firmicutes bacterium]|nr:hypothetical protein [Bacillota bacterium]